MRYYKLTEQGYIKAIGTGKGGKEITEAKYNEIFSMLRNRPTAPDGFAYRLTVELEWELYELPPEEPIEEEMTETEEKAKAYDILMGVEE